MVPASLAASDWIVTCHSSMWGPCGANSVDKMAQVGKYKQLANSHLSRFTQSRLNKFASETAIAIFRCYIKRVDPDSGGTVIWFPMASKRQATGQILVVKRQDGQRKFASVSIRRKRIYIPPFGFNPLAKIGEKV